MRILVISDLPHFVTGGAEMQASRLIEAWSDLGHEVICLGRRMGGSEVVIGRHTIRTRRITTIRPLGRPVRALSYFLSLSRQLWAHRDWADVIYSRFLGDAAATVALSKHMGILRTPFVPTPANAGPMGDISYLRSVPGHRWLINRIDEHSNAVNLIAPRMEEDLREAGFTLTRITTIPNGVPVGALPATRREGPTRFVCVGRLSPQKGYDVLIDALKRRPDFAGRVEIDIVGAGPELEALRARAEGLPPGLLNFRGELGVAEVRSRLLGSDVFLLPSRYEGMSNAALEAMECGLPLVVTRCGGIDQYVTAGGGWVVAAEDAEALASAIGEASSRDRPTLSVMGDTNRKTVEQQFSMDVVARRYIQLFEELVNEGLGRHP